MTARFWNLANLRTGSVGSWLNSTRVLTFDLINPRNPKPRSVAATDKFHTKGEVSGIRKANVYNVIA